MFHEVPPRIFIVRLVVVMVILSALLTYFVSEYFYFFTLMICLNYFQSSFSWGICPPTVVMRWGGWIREDPVSGMELVYLFKIGAPPPVIGESASSTPVATADKSQDTKSKVDLELLSSVQEVA